MEYSNKYLHIGEEIDPDDYVICKYKISTDLGMDKAAAAIAAEQSTGTWTGISTLNEKIFELYSGRVTAIEGDIATIAYPKEDFSLDIGGIPQVLSVISGNLFGLDALKGVRLEDVTFPKSMLNDFLGPRFGSEGLREVLKRPAKPLVGTIVKSDFHQKKLRIISMKREWAVLQMAKMMRLFPIKNSVPWKTV